MTRAWMWLAIVSVVGCSGGDAGGAPPAAAPPKAAPSAEPAGPSAADEAALSERMKSMTTLILKLNDEAVREVKAPNATKIVELLAELKADGEALKGVETKHEDFGRNLEGFIKEVTFASDAAAKDPPDLTVSRGVMTACVFCHESKPCVGDPGALCPDVPGL